MVWSIQIPWLRWPGFPGRPRCTPRTACEADWRRDPLAHPALRAMTQRELGDLPFDPRSVADE
ncbi:hypothetical protein AAFN88_03530 [Pelagibius sp. CAU 1746]|uniref:hypothetical protein n=1 Tax=Pelagibius sp. CAU 1746 TaxID=3140370 RepID=UPI00325C04F1